LLVVARVDAAERHLLRQHVTPLGDERDGKELDERRALRKPGPRRATTKRCMARSRPIGSDRPLGSPDIWLRTLSSRPANGAFGSGAAIARPACCRRRAISSSAAWSGGS
jgi:hypothetical protein